MTYVTVEINLKDISDDDLIEELSQRDFRVTKEDDNTDGETEIFMDKVIQYFNYGQIEESMIYLERVYPELYGLHKMIRKDI